MQKYINNVAVANSAGQLRSISGALVTVTNIDGSAATIYDNNGGAPRTDPLLTDALGAFAFYAADGRYTIAISKVGITTITITDVLLEDPVDGGDIGFVQNLTGAVERGAQDKLREEKSLLDFMSSELRALVLSYGAYTGAQRTAMFTALSAAWASAISVPHDLYGPAGLYEIGDQNFPWRQEVVVSLLDCQDVTIRCDGPGTVFSTVSSAGADVFQLNGLKNFHVKGFPTLTGTLTATAGAGSNGVSITNGFDNLTLEVTPTNCQSIDKTTYVDGGKGITFQSGASSLEQGTAKITAIVKQCFQGFGFEADLVNGLTKKISVDVDLIAEDCFSAVSIGAGAATGAIPAGTHMGVRVKVQSINCQKDVQLVRAHGVQVDAQVITTKTAAARRLDPRSVAWWASDTVVDALQCAYSHYSQVRVVGNKGACDYKARIGGITAGASGLLGATLGTDIYLDIGGTAAISDLFEVDSGGNSISQSELTLTQATTTTIPAGFTTVARSNKIKMVGASTGTLLPAGRVRFPATQDASSDPNDLDDYEEGTWTPALSISGAGSCVVTVQEARYTKIGRMVHAMFVIVRNDATAHSGAVTWSLPFPSTATSQWHPVGTFQMGTALMGAVIIDNYAENICNGYATSGSDLQYSNLVNGNRLGVSFSYMSA